MTIDIDTKSLAIDVKCQDVTLPGTITDARDQKKVFSYALDDRLLGIDYEDAVIETPSVSLTWDGCYPRLTEMEDGTGVTTFACHPADSPGAGEFAAARYSSASS